MLWEPKLFCSRLWGIFLFTDPISDEPARLRAPVTMFINRQSSQLQANEVQFPKYVKGFAKCWKRMRFDQTAHCFVAVKKRIGNWETHRTPKCILVPFIKFDVTCTHTHAEHIEQPTVYLSWCLQPYCRVTAFYKKVWIWKWWHYHDTCI